MIAPSLIAAETLVLYPIEQVAPVNGTAAVYLLGVVLVALAWGFWPAAAMSVASTLAFDYFYVPPAFDLMPTRPEDAVGVGIFLLVALLTSAVADLARSRAVEVSQRRREVSMLAEQQAALRRVATLVARGVAPAEIFAAVTLEMARCLYVSETQVSRYDGQGAADIVASFQNHGSRVLAVGERVTLEGDNVAATVLRTGRPARMNTFDDANGSLAARVRELGIRSVAGAPVMVDGRVWGVALVGSRRREPLPSNIENRIADFADLVATAIANAATRAELQVSRDSLGVLAEQQAALRRVATLVARGVDPSKVFAAVAHEMVQCLDVESAGLFRYEAAGWSFVAVSDPAPERWPSAGDGRTLEGDSILARVLRTGRAARMDSYENVAGSTAALARQLGVRGTVGVPVVVDGRLWGGAYVASMVPEPLPPDTEARIGDFADLVSTAIANAATRAELRVSRDSLGVLAEQQAALRRVATLVARGARPSEVYSVVAEEIVRCLDVDTSGVWRYASDNGITLLAGHSRAGTQYLPEGEHLTTEGDNLGAMVLSSGRATRHHSIENATGMAISRIRQLGVREGVAAPITVEGRIWGLAIAATTRSEPMPPDSEERIGDFADLVATAIANAATRAELIASRARIVTAADNTRRRLERDLHDGAQQRLVSLGLQVRLAETKMPTEFSVVKDQLSEVVGGINGVLTELQEISRGIHPAILSEGGLGPALKTLARRSPVPVVLDVAIERRLLESTEVGAYYVVAEALTNVAKHAGASTVDVGARIRDDKLCLLIRDDGIGGADPAKGSGLIGLIDRVEALGGRMRIDSPLAVGTTLHINIPLKQGYS
ncbi:MULTISPECIES: GAF domain-containing protein [unclassified Mycolicibacterium]|uniref:sensor histidine kinase n=2 Tax=Mycolicibacterium TaxID=1866885 RepID=UPI0013911BA8|nr:MULTISPECIES: GAF domain-containing protein [unclassified Mycolicibacterium]